MNNMEKFKRYIGKGKHFAFGEPDSGESFYFLPLGTDMLPEFLELIQMNSRSIDAEKRRLSSEISRLVSEGKTEEEAMVLAGFDPKYDRDFLKLSVNLIRTMIVRSYPEMDAPESEKTLDDFIVTNFMRLLSILMELNAVSLSSAETMNKIQTLRERVKRDAAK